MLAVIIISFYLIPAALVSSIYIFYSKALIVLYIVGRAMTRTKKNDDRFFQIFKHTFRYFLNVMSLNTNTIFQVGKKSALIYMRKLH